MKHTNGPWHVDSVHSEALHEICITDPPPGEGNPVVLASVEYDYDRGTCPTLKEANANARLMAASPDHALFIRSLLVGTARWEHFGGRSNSEGEVCVGGLRYATKKDEFGVPILTKLIREALKSDLGE